ncbi:MAG: helix-turn-helix domain-containing protein [Caryophanon sp.]|nr:helix-turn-helix domain-containing protein [Caryophanon sp.]
MTTAIEMNLKEMNEKYSPYKHIQQMDETIWQYVEWLNENSFPQSVIDVLLKIGSHSLKNIGLSFPHQTTIAESVGYSRQTVNAALRTLEKLGMIDSVSILKQWGKKGNNGKRKSGKLYRIKPFKLATLQQYFTSAFPDKASDIKDLTLTSEFEPITYEAQDLKKDVAAKANPSTQTAPPKTLYEQLKALAMATTGPIPDFKKLMSVIFGTIKKLKNNNTPLTHWQLEDLMYRSFHALLRKKNIRKRAAMLNKIIANKYHDLLNPHVPEQTPRRVEILPNWFNQPSEKTVMTMEEFEEAKQTKRRILEKLNYDEKDIAEAEERDYQAYLAKVEAAKKQAPVNKIEDTEEDLEAKRQRVLKKLGLLDS